jgi:hypothetical protein
LGVGIGGNEPVGGLVTGRAGVGSVDVEAMVEMEWEAQAQ